MKIYIHEFRNGWGTVWRLFTSEWLQTRFLCTHFFSKLRGPLQESNHIFVQFFYVFYGLLEKITSSDEPYNTLAMSWGSNEVNVVVFELIVFRQNSELGDLGSTQLLNCQWNSSDIDTCQMLKYQSSEPQT